MLLSTFTLLVDTEHKSTARTKINCGSHNAAFVRVYIPAPGMSTDTSVYSIVRALVSHPLQSKVQQHFVRLNTRSGKSVQGVRCSEIEWSGRSPIAGRQGKQ